MAKGSEFAARVENEEEITRRKILNYYLNNGYRVMGKAEFIERWEAEREIRKEKALT